ncbi:riboflavin biosynthesis protein RibD [Reticulibacter mediterranei]|uniref:Riboflavin biosynthesis protein RibD n=1 Tax=Reticulibacter mediterranei TaxID=2778369 RepID=A0A8J3IRC7_9CHLR|nr:dihydrofolate reductase family protein [Reticulibacter mediterranei]GHO93981.1 riboflavin biosynthesis protein RibD [Reticulibacter mediterranei]
MRKVIAVEFLTLDGFVSGPGPEMDWVGDIYTDEIAQALGEGQKSVDTFLLGRVTYQGMVNYWPEKTIEEEPFLADHINPKPKLIFSQTLKSAPWGNHNNARVVKENALEEVQKLKQQSGGDMMIIGSANLLQSFAQAGLIDEYVLYVHPIFVGSGAPLFKEKVNLKLGETKTFRNGVVRLTYQNA